MKLYNKDGKEFNVPHAVDAKEWLASGDFTKDDPKATKEAPKKAPRKESKKD